jgi:HSP20 family protein
MSLVPWRKPQLPTFATLRAEMDRLFDDYLGGGTAVPAPFDKMAFLPAVSLDETPEAYQLKAELPGLNPADIDIQVTENSVVIKGERKEEKKEKKENVIRSEIAYGSFMRRIDLPHAVDPDRAEATMDKGVLTIKVPIVAAAKTKTVKVK